MQIRSGDEVLGMIGTGFEISSLLAPYLEGNQLNYTAFFLDKDAAIQISSTRVGLDVKPHPLIKEGINGSAEDASCGASCSLPAAADGGRVLAVRDPQALSR